MILYRAWTLRTDGLYSMFRDQKWTRLANWARCLAEASQVEEGLVCKSGSPNAECKVSYGCGLYGHLDPAKAISYIGGTSAPKVLGIVHAWGKCVEHEDGVVRAEIMDILALVGCPNLWRIYESHDVLTLFDKIVQELDVKRVAVLESLQAAEWLTKQGQELERQMGREYK